MLKKFFLAITSLLALSVGARASVVFSDSFDAYTPGNLVGQGSYVQQGSSTTLPVQVTAAGSGNVATLNNNGQDINGGFPAALTPADGTSLYFGVTLNVSAAQTGGDYFLGDNTTTGGTNNTDRVFAKSTAGGYLLGFSNSSSSTVTYGTTVLALGTNYRFVLAHNFVAGTLNDTFNLYVNPADTSTESNNTPYLAYTYGGTTAEPTGYGAVLLRQGSATAAPTLTIDNLAYATTFTEAAAVAAVPEPSAYAMIGLGLIGMAGTQRVRRVRA